MSGSATKAQWWVRLGAAMYGPMPWSAVREKRDAGLFSHWHEVSADGSRWLPIDDAGVDKSTKAGEELIEPPPSDEAGQAVDWDAFKGEASSPGGELAVNSPSKPWLDVSQDLRVVAGCSAAVLWLALSAVPIAWHAGQGVHWWSWPDEAAGVGIAIAQACWALLGFAMLIALVVKHVAITDQSRIVLGVAGCVALPFLALLMLGTTPARSMALATGLAVGLCAWFQRRRQQTQDEAQRWMLFAGGAGCLLLIAWWWGGRRDASGWIPLGPDTVASARTQGVAVTVYLLSHAALVLLWLRSPRRSEPRP
ncbi:MAG: hypothetical protein AAGH92_05960 [Planctomycetota bacterium]